LNDAKIKTSCNYLKRRFIPLFTLTVLFASVFFAAVSCIDGVGENSSDDPFGNRIVVVAVNPDIQSGNGSGDSEIQVLVNPDTVPDGSTVLFELNSPNSLPTNLRGCITNADEFIAGSEAFADYMAGINIASGAELSSGEPPIETVNIAATVTPPGENPGSNFDTVALTPVGIIPPEDTELDVPPADDPSSVGLTIEFAAVGLPDGTIVDFTLSNPALGSLNPTSVAVAGGSAVTQYSANNGQAGTQVVTATAVLPNPFDFDPSCPNVPEGDRTIQEIFVITQSVMTDDGGVAEAACDDMVDNDGDGDTDCADSDCEGQECAVGMICTAGACLPPP
jgi:hypothetical protein